MNKVEEFLKDVPSFELQIFDSEKNFDESHVSFIGIPKRHKDRSDRMVLISGVGSGTTFFYEFFIKDVDRIENIETVVSEDGDALPVVRVWIKKGSMALKSEPFVVVDNIDVFKLSKSIGVKS